MNKAGNNSEASIDIAAWKFLFYSRQLILQYYNCAISEM